VLRMKLLTFCSDAQKLEKFYEKVIANLPPIRSTVASSDYGDESD